ncbi:MAG: DUF1353 domain-containing protein [Homoserinimonas sp.]
MPFLDASGEPLKVIPLRQAPTTKPYFQLTRSIGFREHDSSETYLVPPHTADDYPQSGNRTNLASVPAFLHSFIAAYGRQTAPAILHDHRRTLTNQLPATDALVLAEQDDRVFRVALRQQKVPLLRAWLMWAFVSAERYWLYARPRGVLLLSQALLGVALIYTAIVLALGSPLWLLGIAVPAIAALVWKRRYLLVLWLSYGVALLAPLVLLQLCALIPYWLAELLVREAVDRPFLDPDPGPVAVPFGRAP